MKKIILTLLVNIALYSALSAQNFVAPICTCPTQTSCHAECTFSSCCVCWDPKISEGGCGCFWGVSTCKTAKKVVSQLIGTSTDTRIITFKFDAFNSYMLFLQSKGIAYAELMPIYSSFANKYSNPAGPAQIKGEDMDNFSDQYIQIMDKQSDGNKTMVSNYIKSLN